MQQQQQQRGELASAARRYAECSRGDVRVVCTFHNHHIPSACILLYQPVPATFSTLDALKKKHPEIIIRLSAFHTGQTHAGLAVHPSKNGSTCPRQPCSAELLVFDSPVLRGAGCRATVSLLAPFPMLQLPAQPARLSRGLRQERKT